MNLCSWERSRMTGFREGIVGCHPSHLNSCNRLKLRNPTSNASDVVSIRYVNLSELLAAGCGWLPDAFLVFTQGKKWGPARKKKSPMRRYPPNVLELFQTSTLGAP
ncbi:hypothetical protein AVEN_136039-1 [Araneus ventricosus]|uniref:Uncharacterized protein n=1 Tax=Araneus ventricosus TaxID=182803 RepID=A0A4Y2EUD2_ARAVE|nr:hypothetical protein AVEN_136039-1 [Araneus ventricosus]